MKYSPCFLYFTTILQRWRSKVERQSKNTYTYTMNENLFKQKVEEYLRSDPKNKSAIIELDTHLWDNGLVDSFRMVELVIFLEDLLNRDIDINSNFISNFHTIRKMYASLVPAANSHAQV